jgi:hypothetical protein
MMTDIDIIKRARDLCANSLRDAAGLVFIPIFCEAA